MPNSLASRAARPVPRYTSYPTAPHFHPGITDADYAGWLGALPTETDLSLYVHVPFCDRLCWFCGCHTKQVLRYGPIAAYLPAVHLEMEEVARHLDGRGRATALHLGGGSPSMLRPDDLIALAQRARQLFRPRHDFEFSIEIDPNDMTEDRYDAFAAAGVNRISVGVQDFDPRVQQAINRLQSFEQTRAVVEGMRRRGVSSVNLDVLYGLPHQTVGTLEATIEQALALHPDRLALFGYAHVPWMKTHQRMIDAAMLPDPQERLRQSAAAAARIVAAGYVAIGLDHFAKPADRLAIAAGAGQLRRNFQGYTTDAAPALIGFGASSIGSLPQGYVQNTVATGEYVRAVKARGLAIARGIALSSEDRMRGWVIERLMCDLAVSVPDLRRRFGSAAEAVLVEMAYAAQGDADGIVEFDGRRFAITDAGRPYVRSVAAAFDTYLSTGTGRHSVAV
ncbi:MAG TPA: oxygen-independent coproporphyrinogen III oxidase [Devosia sp.]|jgi:oxygen-independent coproporphyrinogen-3 oxidase|uniref:oxygen-independent coproporphyrinogen III oxidase n=1 Tax=Devosia sp. TaxID=1871048 RepID=UPI002DDD4F40|nr:oxygen-independent coproporphyrinogen III oxidase [Devosia sp.]HEV2516189.1 oxygen-independent coproporphyrinogen III oxidase [Devosia sp.]